MTYQPKMKPGGSFGPQGVAKILVNPNDTDQLRFKLHEKKWNPLTNMVEENDYKGQILRSNCPEKVRPLLRPGEWYISVNNELTKVFTVRPVEGVYEVKVDHFSAPEGQQPSPKMSNGKFPHPFFTVILKIVGGAEAGMEVPYTLRYHFDKEFEPIDQKGTMREVVSYAHPKSQYTPLLRDFMDAAGAWVNGPMPYKDNILPMLEKRIKDQGRVFKVVLADGQVKSVVGGKAVEFTPDVEE